MSKPLTLSIIIPTYNEERHLAACLKAIAAQTVRPDEVIVVDNNSTDATMEIARSYSFVRLLSEKRQGVGFARDCGFDAARTDIIARIDADTHVPPHWVANILALFADYRIAALTGPVGYYDMPLPNKNYWFDHQIRLHLYYGAPKVPFLFGSNSALRRDAWQNIRYQVCHIRTVHEDLDLAIHLAQAGLHIQYDGNLLAGTSARRYDDTFRSFRHYMNMYRYTYRKHGIHSFVPHIATDCYWLGYLTLRPFRLAYDDVSGRRTFRQLIKGHTARKNPMAG